MHSGLQELQTQFANGEISRRDLIWRASGFVGGLALTGFLATCGVKGVSAAAPMAGEPSRAGRTAQDATPKEGGTFSLGITADPVLNPLISSGIQSILVHKVLFNGLTRPEPATLLPVPDLAESWEPNEDLTEWTFVLRKDVKWHDGEPFSADDVVFTYESRLNEEGLSAGFRELELVEKVDDSTVTFRLSEPLGHLPTLLSYNQFIVPKHVLEGKKQVDNIEFSKQKPIGTGAYMIEEFSAGNYVSTKRNPDFHFGQPHIERFVFKVLPDLNTQVSQLRTGELSFVPASPSHAASLQAQPDLIISPIEFVDHHYIAFQFDGDNTLVGNPLFTDPQVRLGLAYAMDRQAILDIVTLGYGTAATGTVSIALQWAYNDTLSPIPYDKDKALSLLAEAGWTPGDDGILQNGENKMQFTLSVDKDPVREQTATIVQQMLNDIGCDVTLETLDWSTFAAERWQARQFDALMFWSVTAPDPDQYDSYACDGEDNFLSFCNEEMTDLLAEGRRTSDPEKRREIYFKFQELEMEDPPVNTLYYPQEVRAYSNKLKNLPELGYRDILIYSYDLWFDE